MKKAGYILIALQIIAMVSSLISSGMPFPSQGNQGGGNYIIELIGFFLPTIIGLILIKRAKAKEK